MKPIALFIVFLFAFCTLNAQSKLDFIQVDTATYSAYLNSDWDRIISVGEQAVDQQIDYYYLRLRIAYAYFVKGRYRQAIPHYKKALVFSENDAIASEYLYYCYLYSGRVNDALKLQGQFSSSLKGYIDENNPNKFFEIGTYLTFGNGLDAGFKDEQIQDVPTTYDGAQIMPNKLFNFNTFVSHKVGSAVMVRHTVNLMYKDEYALAVLNATPYLSESQTVRQFNYHLALDVTPFEGFTITPVVSFINYRIPVFYEYGNGSNRNRAIYTYKSYNEASIGVKAKKQFGLLEAGLSYSHSNFNLCQQNTAGVLLAIYPFGNLNFYYTGAFYYHSQTQNSSAQIQYIQSHKIGLKVYKNIWAEGLVMFGGFTNFYDIYTELTYNSLEKYNSIQGINLIYPFNKRGGTLFLGFRNYMSETMFVPNDDVFNTFNAEKMNYQSITGGISWKF